MSLRVADEQISTISFEGQALNTARGTSAYGQAYDPATDHESMTSTGVPTILIGNAVYEATDCTVDFDSRIVGRRRIGTEGPGSLRRGRMRVTGTINVYLDAWTEIDKHEAGSVSSLVLGMESSDGYAYSLSIPELRWTQAMTDTEGPDLDDFARLSFQGELDATEGITARWQSFAA
ncbi:MAG: hypothetical protein KDE27_08060 [Planctomycetes bacterium]|nr:hypothetical protein [Planctomycetota bacterium]